MQGNNYESQLNASFEELLKIRAIKDGWHENAHDKHLRVQTIKYQDNELKLGNIYGTIPANFEKAVYYYSQCLEGQKKCREMCDELKVIEAVDNDTSVILFRTKSKLVVSAREMICVQTKRKINDNETVILRSQLQGHPNVPISKDFIRAETKVYGVFLKKISENETGIEIYILSDLKGSIPAFMANSMFEKQLNSFEKDITEINKI